MVISIASDMKKKSNFFSIDQILGKREEEIEIEERKSIEFVEDETRSNQTSPLSSPKPSSEDSSPVDKKDTKQTPSYTAIIAQAILNSDEKKLPLGDVYDYIAVNFPDFLKKGQGWRNCVRHNLSLSECFIKAGRARNGRGNYWGIHPRYIKNFSKGDYRKRRASHRPRNATYTHEYKDYHHPYNYLLAHNEYMIKPAPPTAYKPAFAVDSTLGEKKYHAEPSFRERNILRCPPTLYPNLPPYYPSKELSSLPMGGKVYPTKLSCSCPRCPPC